MQFNLKKNTHLYELFMRQLKEIAGRYTQFLFFILFIGRENWSTWRKPPTCQIDKLYNIKMNWVNLSNVGNQTCNFCGDRH
jgi:hypothetical protein